MKIVAVIIAALALVACSGFNSTKKVEDPCKINNDNIERAGKIQADQMKQEYLLKNSIVKSCIDKGLIPVLVGGNLDCKVMK